MTESGGSMMKMKRPGIFTHTPLLISFFGESTEEILGEEECYLGTVVGLW